ncbi:hypothetical protein ACWEKT_27665 [Nocardia takedensis]|uniref:hypothetical protein n=1 Tax=Nocardia takedensis TaxID=259390 RepID=UPI0003020085|nr:hypothetical protein [Nocardia takedensis]
MLFPRDSTFFDRLAAFVDYEPVEAIDLRLRGMMASLGIVAGHPDDDRGHHTSSTRTWPGLLARAEDR